MTYRIFRRPQALRDLEECFVFIAKENPDAALSFLIDVEESLEQIAKFPEIGKQRFFGNQVWRDTNVAGFELQ